VQGTQEKLELNGLNQTVLYTDGVNLLGENIKTTKSNAEILLHSKEIDVCEHDTKPKSATKL
jgi:hypothetical protein